MTDQPEFEFDEYEMPGITEKSALDEYNRAVSEAAQKLREKLLAQSSIPVPPDPTRFLWHSDRLVREASDKFYGTYIGPAFDRDALFKLLVQSVCPAVCVGVVNETGWHTICETKAHKAMKELGYE